MPIIHYLCECSFLQAKFFRTPKEIPSIFPCTNCQKSAKRILKAPASTSVVTVDNGVQARKVDVNLDIVESIQERSTKDFKND